MRVFVTGATGFIGSAVVKELIGAGHQVTGLARSEGSAKTLAAAGAKVERGSIEDLEVLRRGAANADGVVHTAFFHELGQMSLGRRLGVFLGGSPAGIVKRYIAVAVEADRRALETMGSALGGRDKPLVAAFGTMAMKAGQLATEDEEHDPNAVGGARGESEKTMQGLAAMGVRTSIVRLAPVVHDREKAGLATMMIAIAKKKGVSAYVGDGLNRWPGLDRLDAALLFRLALENGPAGGRYHGVAEEGVRVREIAEAIGKRLNVPVESKSKEEAGKHFSWLAPFIGNDNPASSRLTQQRLGWRPAGAGMIADLAG
jgi:nucleoside-diphosphate-sugar epimerase